jgi:hypothetical protein
MPRWGPTSCKPWPQQTRIDNNMYEKMLVSRCGIGVEIIDPTQDSG